MTKKWNEQDSRWLKANHGRMDVQSLAHELGFPLSEVENRIRQLFPVESSGGRKAPATLKEAVRELSAARKDYEKAIELFHRRRLEEAAERFEELLVKHPDEKELLDRARMYLAACRNGKKGKMPGGSELDDLYHAAVFEKNRGNLEGALELLKKSSARRDGDGRLLYLAACVHALAGESDEAISSLKRAIAADSQNRIQARLENDLASLRGVPGFSELLTGA